MKLTKQKAQQLRLLFKQQDKYADLKNLAEHAALNESLVLKSSKRSNGSIEIHDSELFRLIQNWAQGRLTAVEAQLEEVEV